MVTRLGRELGLLLAALLFASGCRTDLGPASPKRLVVPDEMRRSPPKPGGTVAPAQRSDAPRYVFRLAEGGRVWEVELPESSGAYEVRVPLTGGGPAEMLTPADEEILGQLAPGAPDGGVDARATGKRKSYLGSLAKVNEMFASKKYELALIELVNLEKEYPQDARVLAMKGSLYFKLGKVKLAREAWEKSLALNPGDLGVAEALRELGNREE